MCVLVCTYASADLSVFEWLQREETKIDKMIIGLFTQRKQTEP